MATASSSKAGSSPKTEPSCPTVPSTSTLTGHYRTKQALFSVYKGSRVVVLNTPTPQEAQSSEPVVSNPDFRRPTYITPRMPYHLFIPKYNPWHGPLLGILDYTFENLPIVQYGEMWSLDRDIVQAWRDFEDCLRSVGRELPWLASKPFPKNIEPWFIPGRYHYSLYYRTEKGARCAVWRGRKKFLPLLGYASMGLWFMAHEEMDEADAALGIISGSKRKAEDVYELKSTKRTESDRRPEQTREEQMPWRQALTHKLNILPSWIDALESSVANDWRNPRVGGLVDLRSGEGLRSAECTGLEWLIYSILQSSAPIPLYFVWGPIPTSISISYATPKYMELLHLVPDSRQIDQLVKLTGDVAFSPLTRTESGFQPALSLAAPVPPRVAAKADFFIPRDREDVRLDYPLGERQDIHLDPPRDDREDILLDFPPVHPGSGQRQGEHMENYFARRERENGRRSAKETLQEKTARMQRVDSAKLGQAPGKKGARVYVWAKEETDNGFYIRRPGGRNNYQSLFDDYPPSQRRYDSFHDEWDLCSAFGDDGLSDRDKDFEDDDNHYDGYLETDASTLVIDDSANCLPLVSVRPASERDLKRIYLEFGSGVQDDRPLYQPIAGDLNTALYKRFGFLMGQSQRTPSRKVDMSVVASLVGLQDIGTNFVNVMATFFGQCLEAKNSDDLDEALFDLHHQNHSPLFQPWPFIIRREILRNPVDGSTNIYYVLCDHGSGLGSETLLLQQAADVVEIIRQGWGPRVKDVAKSLLMRGIPFRIAVMESIELMRPSPVPSPVPGPLPRVVDVNSGLGFRPEKYEPGLHDYHAYLAQLNSQLLHTRRGRIAPPYGGVIGRIARAEVADDDVLRGPSGDVFETGVCLWDGQSNHAYWHESLTEHEIDLICGVYYVATGVKSDRGAAQTKMLSWWPKPHSWKAGNLDPGWWSPECEVWFERRLSRLGDGQRYGEKGMLAKAAEWKHNLRFVKILKECVQANERISAGILQKLCPSA